VPLVQQFARLPSVNQRLNSLIGALGHHAAGDALVVAVVEVAKRAEWSFQ
jgi:hypothetical protein